MNPTVWWSKPGVIATLVLCQVIAFSCKPKPDQSALEAIINATGEQAFGLIPLRQFHPPQQSEVYRESDEKILMDALRTKYAVVECHGPNASLHLNTLESLASKSADPIRRHGRKLYAVDKTGGIDFSRCELLGSHVFVIATFAGVFGVQNPSLEQKELQQVVWLALRGRSQNPLEFFSAPFYDFLVENLGATPTTRTAALAVIKTLDQQYNPCAQSEAEFFDKTHYFQCVSGNYRPTHNYNGIKQRLVDQIAAFETPFVNDLKESKAPGNRATTGHRVALEVDKTITDLGIKSHRKINAPEETTSGPTVFADDTPSAIHALLDSERLEQIKELFQLQVGNTLGFDYSISTPRRWPVAPDSGDGARYRYSPRTVSQNTGFLLYTKAGKDGKPPGTGWEKMKSCPTCYQKKLPDGRYSTTIGKNGKYYTKVWQ